MNKKLIEAVKKQLNKKGEELTATLNDIVNHGIGGGFSGFIYYSDTVKFFKKHRAEIVRLVKEQSDDFGQTPIQFVAGFNCLNGNYKDTEGEAEISRALYGNLQKDDAQIPNALTWYAVEEVARHEVDK